MGSRDWNELNWPAVVIIPPRLNYKKIDLDLNADIEDGVSSLMKQVDDYTSVKFQQVSCEVLKKEVQKKQDNAFIFFGPKSFIATDGPMGKLT